MRAGGHRGVARNRDVNRRYWLALTVLSSAPARFTVGGAARKWVRAVHASFVVGGGTAVKRTPPSSTRHTRTDMQGSG